MTMSGGEIGSSGSNFTPKEIADALHRQSKELFVGIQVPLVAEGDNVEVPDFSPMKFFFLNLLHHVQNDILEKTLLSDRVIEMNRWIAICDECYKNGDLNSAKAIATALDWDPISKLGLTRAYLLFEKKESFDLVSKLTSDDKKTHDSKVIITVPYYLSVDQPLTRMKENIRSAENAKGEAGNKEDQLVDLNYNIVNIRRMLTGFTEDLKSKQEAARLNQATISAGSSLVNEYIASLNFSKEISTKEFFQISDANKKKVKAMGEPRKVDNLKSYALETVFKQAATGGLNCLIGALLKNKSGLEKVKQDVILSSSFIKDLNKLLVQKSPDKGALTKLLETAGIPLDDKNYQRVCRQAGYRDQLSPEAKAMIGHQYIKGKKFLGMPNTRKKVKKLNDCFLTAGTKRPQQAAQDIQSAFESLGIKVKSSEIESFCNSQHRTAIFMNRGTNDGRNLKATRVVKP